MKRWWILKDRLRHGPFSESELLEHVKNQRFAPTDFVVEEDVRQLNQLNHRTLSEVLSSESLSKLNNQLASTLKAPATTKIQETTSDASTSSPNDPLPKIRELLSKIEAVELIDTPEKDSIDSSVRLQAIAQANDKNLIQFFREIYTRFKPAFAVLVLTFVSSWFFGRFTSAPVVKSTVAVKAPAPNPLPQVTKREVVANPKVKLPTMSQRSADGFERVPASVPEEGGEDARGADQRLKKRKALSDRRDSLRKLRNALSPEPEGGSDSIPGIAPGNDQEQAQYDDERYNKQADEIVEEAPAVDEGEDLNKSGVTDDSRDNEGDLEYQQ